MQISEISLLIIFLVFLALLVTIFHVIKRANERLRSMETRVENAEFFLNKIKVEEKERVKAVENITNELKTLQLEQQQVDQQLEHRIKVLQESLEQTNTNINQIAQQQPEDKLYQRAQKMVTLGAGIDEIMHECELPQAEAEILISMHQRASNKQ